VSLGVSAIMANEVRMSSEIRDQTPPFNEEHLSATLYKLRYCHEYVGHLHNLQDPM
jgi:hypothetical protein